MHPQARGDTFALVKNINSIQLFQALFPSIEALPYSNDKLIVLSLGKYHFAADFIVVISIVPSLKRYYLYPTIIVEACLSMLMVLRTKLWF